MSKIIKIGVGIGVATLLVVGGIKAVHNAQEKDTRSPKAKLYPIVVSHFDAKMRDVQLTLPYLAEVANDKDVKLSSRIAARILKIQASGTPVKKGDVVVRLDTTSIQSSLVSVQKQLQAANISLKNLQGTHKRTLELRKVQGASVEESQKEMGQIANMQAQKASLIQKEIQLKNNLSYANIISPVNGVIAKTFSNRGALSTPGKSLVAISSKNGFYLMVRVPSHIPMKGVLFHNKKYSLTPLGTTYHSLLEYKVYTGDTKLISGDRVEVDVIILERKAMLLPFNTVLNKDGKSYVLRIKGKSAKLQEVHIVQSAEQGVVISENLEGIKLVLAKPDILLRLASGYALQVKE